MNIYKYINIVHTSEEEEKAAIENTTKSLFGSGIKSLLNKIVR